MVAKKKKAVKKAAKAKAKTTAAKSAKKAVAKKAVKKTTAKKATAKKVVKKAAVKAKAKPKAAVAKTTPSKKSAASAKKASSKVNKTPSTPATKPKSVASAKPRVKSDDLAFGNYTPYDIKKGEDYMNAEQVEHFRNILMGWKRELMDKVDETVHHLQDEAANFPDPNDRASQESEFTLELRTRDRERKLIKKIEESLKALDDDEYGYCTSCGVDIGIRRLEARPTATECIDCKTLNEIREKQYGK